MLFRNNFLEILDCQEFVSRINDNGFSIESPPPQEQGLSFEILIVELKPVVAEKFQFE